MKRTDLICVSLDVHRYMVERLRAMTPEQRWEVMFSRIELGRMIHVAALKRREEDRRA